jgi:uncharacterized protein
VLAVEPECVRDVCARFDALGITSAAVGKITDSRKLELTHGSERELYWDLGASALTGFGASPIRQPELSNRGAAPAALELP